MTLCYPPFIGRLAFAAVDGELHSNFSGFILFFRNNRVGFGGSFYIGSVIQKQKNGEPFAYSRWNYRFQRFIVFSCFSL